MSARRRVLTMLPVLPVVVLAPATLAGLAMPSGAEANDPGAGFVLVGFAVMTCGGIGAFLIGRQPRNAVGWVLWTAGVGIGLAAAGSAYAVLGTSGPAQPLPGVLLAAWLSNWLFTPSLALAVLFLPLLFPAGRPPEGRWRWLVVVFAVVIAEVGLPDLLRPGEIASTGLTNPTGWSGDPAVLAALGSMSQLSAPIAIPLAIAAAVTRFRHGGRVERQQLRWFGTAAALAGVTLAAAAVLPGPASTVAWLGAMTALGLVPVAIGVAVLRYRLYDIDRIVSRTLAWALVTVVLVAVFSGLVVGLQALLIGVTQGQTLAVAASTLFAFALAQPVRLRVQRAVDRRFNRARYDAERVVTVLAERLRGETDLVDIRREVVTAVERAIQPTTAVVWVRGGVR